MATSVFIFTRISANYKLSVCTSWDVLRQFNGPESEKWSMNEIKAMKQELGSKDTLLGS